MNDKDAITEAELRALIAHVDPVPPLLDDAARADDERAFSGTDAAREPAVHAEHAFELGVA